MSNESISDEIWSILKETSQNIKKMSAETDKWRAVQKEASQKVAKEMKEWRAVQREASEKAAKEMKEWRASQKEASEKAAKEMKEWRAVQKEASEKAAKEMKELRTVQKEASQKAAKEMKDLRAVQKEASQKAAKEMKEWRVSQKEVSQKAAKEMKEWRVSQKETDQRLDKLFAETDQRLDKIFTEVAEQMKQTDKKFNAFIGDLGNRWGKLGENLVKGNLAKKLKERGIEVEKVITNLRNRFAEFDIIAINGREIVIVEVKATLDPSDVNEFMDNIKRFKVWWPYFKEKTLYGAMAFLIKANRQADSLARKQGFFVIEATGDVVIQNKPTFEPKVFS